MRRIAARQRCAIVEQVRWCGVVYKVTTFGQPVAVILSVEEYARLTGGNAQAEPLVSDGSGEGG